MLDATFGNRGRVVTSINDSSTANDIAIQPDGKIVVGGNTHLAGISYFTLVRYNIDGSLDNTFGNAGKVITTLKHRSTISSITIQMDGKILAGGSVYGSGMSYLTDSGYSVVRYNANGGLDSSFGVNGITLIKMSNGLGYLKKLLVKPNGKIVTAGFVNTMTFQYMPALVQLNTNGTLDSSFGTNGKVEGYINDIEAITDMAIANDGKIIASAQIRNSPYYGDFALMGFLQNGHLDSSFGTNGVVKTDFNNNAPYKTENATSLIRQADGSIIMAGYNYTSPATFALAKYKANGSLDSAFGVDGKVITPILNTNGYAHDVLADHSGNLFVSGYAIQSQVKRDFAVAKYFFNGRIDSSYGRNGIDTTEFFGFSDIAYASALQPDGKIVLVGQAGIDSNRYSIALARYTLNVLPLKSLNFTASKDGKSNVLHWSTEEEINVAKFEIERSNNGREYNSIGKVNAGLRRYHYTDINPLKGSNYYRLKVIDKDGKFDYSAVRIINNNSNINVRVYPVPVKGTLNLQMYSIKTEKAQITVTDILGKNILTMTISLEAGLNHALINLQKLYKGAYFLKVVTYEGSNTKKIVVD
jgi:uncharacterized delta-60 repeat protein